MIMIRSLFTISICFITLYVMNANEPVKIKITVGANSFVATLHENATAKAFVLLLPLTITMNELNRNEKYYYLPDSLPHSPERQSKIKAGDLMIYGENCLVLFYETFSTSYSYTRIGYVSNPTGLEAALGSGNPTITFERQD